MSVQPHITYAKTRHIIYRIGFNLHRETPPMNVLIIFFLSLMAGRSHAHVFSKVDVDGPNLRNNLYGLLHTSKTGRRPLRGVRRLLEDDQTRHAWLSIVLFDQFRRKFRDKHYRTFVPIEDVRKVGGASV